MPSGPKAGLTYEEIAKDLSYVTSLTSSMKLSQQETRFVNWYEYTYGGYISETISQKAISRSSGSQTKIREEPCEICFSLVLLDEPVDPLTKRNYCQDCGWAEYIKIELPYGPKVPYGRKIETPDDPATYTRTY